jgi:flavodoxin
MKTLVVFYSQSGNTRRVAQIIAQQLTADLEELVDRRARRGIFGFLRSGRDAFRGRTTEIEPLRRQPSEYDLIVVGTPVWAARPAPAVRTFLQSHDLGGKKVALFCTMSSQGGEKTCAILKDLLPRARLVGSLALAMKKSSAETIEERVLDWVAQWKGRS